MVSYPHLGHGLAVVLGGANVGGGEVVARPQDGGGHSEVETSLRVSVPPMRCYILTPGGQAVKTPHCAWGEERI